MFNINTNLMNTLFTILKQDDAWKFSLLWLSYNARLYDPTFSERTMFDITTKKKQQKLRSRSSTSFSLHVINA